MKFLPHILYNYSYSAYLGLFEILFLTVFSCVKIGEKHVFLSFRKISAILLFLQEQKIV